MATYSHARNVKLSETRGEKHLLMPFTIKHKENVLNVRSRYLYAFEGNYLQYHFSDMTPQSWERCQTRGLRTFHTPHRKAPAQTRPGGQATRILERHVTRWSPWVTPLLDRGLVCAQGAGRLTAEADLDIGVHVGGRRGHPKGMLKVTDSVITRNLSFLTPKTILECTALTHSLNVQLASLLKSWFSRCQNPATDKLCIQNTCPFSLLYTCEWVMFKCEFRMHCKSMIYMPRTWKP